MTKIILMAAVMLASISLTACAGVEPFQLRLEGQVALQKPIPSPSTSTTDAPVSP